MIDAPGHEDIYDDFWCVDVVPFLRPYPPNPTQRAAVVLVTAGTRVMQEVLIDHPGFDAVSDMIVQTVQEAAKYIGGWPTRLAVPQEFAEEVEIGLEQPDVLVEPIDVYVHAYHNASHVAYDDDAVAPAIATLRRAALAWRTTIDGEGLREEMIEGGFGGVFPVPVSAAPLWHAWGVSNNAVIDTFFRASAALVSAVQRRGFASLPHTYIEDNGDDVAEWRDASADIPDEDLPDPAFESGLGPTLDVEGGADAGCGVFMVESPDAQESVMTVYGEGTRLDAVLVYTDSADWDALQRPRDQPDHSMPALLTEAASMVAVVRFGSADTLPPGMADEIAAHGWTVAGPTAYPVLWLLNAPGGALDPDYLTSLGKQLGALARAIEAEVRAPIMPTLAMGYWDQGTGIRVATVYDV